ncbi:MAG TPA: hypothetical protein PLK94_05720 [Alphaproteobacteria bacterium]|nr:hypothetical protein [Alphaproteobacteria bacterium]HOO50774.1 hypothetical protein [Alphaproteobacteria bacterium]
MTTLISDFSFVQSHNSQRGSGLFIILVAVVLFAALTYAISNSSDGSKNLSQEKVRLYASEILDTGNRYAETIARMKLQGIAEDEISFLYNGNYSNAACLTDACKVFAFDGGGLEWDTPPIGSNNGEEWFFTGDVAIQDIGTSAADLLAILPVVNEDVCHRINVLIDIEGESDTTALFGSAIAANAFVGSYDLTPDLINHASVNGKRSGCISISSLTSDITASSPIAGQPKIYYQVLLAR